MAFIIRISPSLRSTAQKLNKSTTSSIFLNGSKFRFATGEKVGEIVWKDDEELSLDIDQPCTIDIQTKKCICGYSRNFRYEIPASATSMELLENGIQIKSNNEIINDDTATTQSKIIGLLLFPWSILIAGNQRPYTIGVYRSWFIIFALIFCAIVTLATVLLLMAL